MNARTKLNNEQIAAGPHPYFGAIATRCGVEYLENIQTRDE